MDTIFSEKVGQILKLTLNRPEKKNALTPQMYSTLTASLNEAKADFDIRVVVITGSGSAFTGGNDIFDFANTPPTGPDSPVMQFLAVLHDFPKPLIAAVHGNAVGIGTTMLLHCDLVYATADAKFSMPFVSLGLVPEAGSSLLFPRLVGHVIASEIFLTGRNFSGTQAHEMRLVNSIEIDPLAKAMEIADEISKQPPTAVINTKALLKSSQHQAVAMVMEAEGELFRIALESDEAQLAFMNFLAKKSKG
ncbi:MAG: enoyl-CoA hydratase [SAR202 cluster bacterium]|nr:enoyl-CoA hydratase [SAR202 cluster bacterium]